MFRNQRALVALSGLDVDRELITYARNAAAVGIFASLQFVHVVKPDAPPLIAAKARTDVESLVSASFGDPPSGVRYEIGIVSGIRTDALIETAEKSRADVVLLGHRHGRSGHRSLARRLAMAAPCSVWLVPEGAPGTIRTVLAPIDFSDHSADALRAAASIARSTHARECIALHVSFDSTVVGYDEHAQEMHLTEHEQFKQFLAPLDFGGMEVRTQCEEGPEPARTILRVVEERQSDLIVLSTRGRSRAAAVLLGSVTARVVERSPVAVLAVKHAGAFMGLLDVLKQPNFWTGPNPKTN